MKIAILGTKGIPGHHGVEAVVDSLVPHLVSKGHDITVYGYDSYARTVDNYRGVRVKVVPGSSSKNIEMIAHMWNASRDTRRESYDLVHIHSVDPCLLAWLPRARYGIVATSHGQAYLRKKWGTFARVMSRIAERFFLHIPDVITCVSKPLADYYKSRYGRDVIYIPNGMELRNKPDKSLLRKWDIDPQNYLFCSAGRIERTKGLHTLLEAYRKLQPGIPLVIAGGGSGTDVNYFHELKQSKTPGVKFVGFQTGDDYSCLYAHARVFVFPSEYEAMSMALLEGLSFGIATVYSDTPENKAVADGMGFPFEVSNADSLANQLDYVLVHPSEATDIAQKAKIGIEKRHNWTTIANQYNEVYSSLCKR
ncbi:MAG: glycosyltransferase family 4 protein [Candidatus Eisenbacteria bacterium]|nr:glycosyltransferase family 4 protein [Candidatus Eisenbacteria bacterium]